MKCRACDCLLTNFESTRKSITTGDYIDFCNTCFEYIKDEVQVIEREDLRTSIPAEEEEEQWNMLFV